MDPDEAPEITVLPAQAGWYVVETVWESEGGEIAELFLQPVIGWVVKVEKEPPKSFNGEWRIDCYPSPMTAGGVEEEPILKTPDGVFCAPYLWDTEDEAVVRRKILEERQREIDRQKARAEKKAKA